MPINPKPGNFGGLPEDQFEEYQKAYSSVGITGINDAQKIAVLKALACEEHAALKASDTVDVVAVVMKCIDLKNKHKEIVLGGATTQNTGDFIVLLNDLRDLWLK